MRGRESRTSEIIVATVQRGLTGNLVWGMQEIFAEEGLRVRLITAGVGLAIVDALRERHVGYANVLAGPILAALHGADVRIVMTYQNKGWQLWARPEISRLQDLEGKRVSGGSPLVWKYLERYLRQEGVDPARINWTAGEISVSDLYRGHAEAALLLAPMTVKARRSGLRHLLEIAEEMPTFGVVTTERKIREDRDEVSAVVRAVLRSLQRLQTAWSEGVDIAVRELHTPPELADEAVRETVGRFTPMGEVPVETQRAWIALGCELIGRPPVAPSQVFNFHILREVRGG